MTEPRAYYNEIDPAAAHILRALIEEGVIVPGDVDTRSIKEVQPDDLDGYTQCHFFAGGGLWSVAARLAGWPDDRPLWTGSCPCQPFSAAGKGLGTNDPRHLWPDFHRLIRARRPAVIMGEQVAGAPGYGWFDGVSADLEGEGYASRAVDFPACSVDAPHQRNRLYWIAVNVADSNSAGPATLGRDAGEIRSLQEAERGPGPRLERHAGHGDGSRRPEQGRPVASPDGAECGLPSDAAVSVLQGQPPAGDEPDNRADAGLHADANSFGRRQQYEQFSSEGTRARQQFAGHHGRNGTYWSGAEWLLCHDGKARRAEPGIRFLVDGLPGRVDLWRVGGNAIVPEAAAEVIAAFMDVEADLSRASREAAE